MNGHEAYRLAEIDYRAALLPRLADCPQCGGRPEFCAGTSKVHCPTCRAAGDYVYMLDDWREYTANPAAFNARLARFGIPA